MRPTFPFAVGILLAAFSHLQAESASAILARMDAAAPKFQGATANIRMVEFNALLADHTTEEGTFQMQKRKGQVRALIAFTATKDAKTLSFSGKMVRIYYPNLGEYQDIDLGDKASLTNQILLLGFGSSGKELARSYDIKEDGTETINGQPSTRLALMPKDSQVKEKLSKILIWIPPNSASPIQQEFFDTETGNSRTITYTDLQINPSTQGSLELKLPANAKKQKKE